MVTVGVRELKNRLSHYLELARNGEPVTVTAHGREIAQMVPAGPSKEVEALMRMVREGKATWGGGKPKGASRRVSPSLRSCLRTGVILYLDTSSLVKLKKPRMQCDHQMI